MSSSLPPIYDPSSPEYKRARRQHLKTTKSRSEQLEADWTPFRAAEKKFKAKFPPPDLSDVLDLAVTDEGRTEEINRGGWRGSSDSVERREIALEDASRKAYILPQIPGLVLLPSYVTPAEQRNLVRWSLKDHAKPPNETNLDTHYILPEEGLWNAYLHAQESAVHEESIQPRASSSSASTSGPRTLIQNTPASPAVLQALLSLPTPPPSPSPNVRPATPAALIPKLRWANIGWHYHWGNKQYDFTRGKAEVAQVYKNVCSRAIKGVDWEAVYKDVDTEVEWGDEGDWRSWRDSYEPDAGIVNYYQIRDTLMAHVDRSELCATSPLVSISLGCAAVFLIGGPTRESTPVPILLRSGDVAIMSGPCRRAYHGVPRILENTLPPHFIGENEDESDEWAPYEQYLRTTRINVNVRQVFPRGFDPTLATG